MDPSIVAFYALFAIATLTAYLRGGAPERWGAAILTAAFLFQTSLSQTVITPRWMNVDFVSTTADLFVFAGFAWLALSARRQWPIWATALQILSLGGHLSRAVQLDLHPLAYALLRSTPTAVALAILLLGVIAHRKRLGKYHSDPSWVDWQLSRDLGSAPIQINSGQN